MAEVSEREIEREARLCAQTLEMHHTLRDRYARRALFAELVLWGAAIIFCATTFADDSLYVGLGLSAERSRLLLGVASVLALIASSALLLIDWKGASARHADAARRWAGVSRLFRQYRRDDGQWPEATRDELHNAYWDAAGNSVEIPTRKFNSLKESYLLKVEISKRAGRYPGVPRFLLWMIVRWAGARDAIREGTNADRDGRRDDGSVPGKPD